MLRDVSPCSLSATHSTCFIPSKILFSRPSGDGRRVLCVQTLIFKEILSEVVALIPKSSMTYVVDWIVPIVYSYTRQWEYASAEEAVVCRPLNAKWPDRPARVRSTCLHDILYGDDGDEWDCVAIRLFYFSFSLVNFADATRTLAMATWQSPKALHTHKAKRRSFSICRCPMCGWQCRVLDTEARSKRFRTCSACREMCVSPQMFTLLFGSEHCWHQHQWQHAVESSVHISNTDTHTHVQSFASSLASRIRRLLGPLRQFDFYLPKQFCVDCSFVGQRIRSSHWILIYYFVFFFFFSPAPLSLSISTQRPQSDAHFFISFSGRIHACAVRFKFMWM